VIAPQRTFRKKHDATLDYHVACCCHNTDARPLALDTNFWGATAFSTINAQNVTEPLLTVAVLTVTDSSETDTIWHLNMLESHVPTERCPLDHGV
jgi:hypothetical protein